MDKTSQGSRSLKSLQKVSKELSSESCRDKAKNRIGMSTNLKRDLKNFRQATHIEPLVIHHTTNAIKNAAQVVSPPGDCKVSLKAVDVRKTG